MQHLFFFVSLFHFLPVLAKPSFDAVTFLPKGSVVDAYYSVIEPDPAFADYGKKIREAKQKDPAWFAEFSRKQQSGAAYPPYDPHFGVSKTEYEYFIQPAHQYRQVNRRPIKVRRADEKGVAHLTFEGQDLLFSKLTVDHEKETVVAVYGVLRKRASVDLEIATVPPGRHRGVSFETPNETVISDRRLERVFIGELKDTKSTIIHYTLVISGNEKRIAIEIP